MTGQRIQQSINQFNSRRPSVISGEKQRLVLRVSKPSISQWSQIKQDTVEPSVSAREFNLKAYAAIT